MADPTPQDFDAAHALLRGLCRAYLDGGEAAVIAKLAECCKAIDASDGAPTGEEVPTRCPVCGCSEDFLQQQGAPPGRGALRCKAFGHMRPARGWSRLPWETPEAPPEPPPPLPMGTITEEEIARHVNSILALDKSEGGQVALTCALSVYQNGLSDHYYAEADDEEKIRAPYDANYAWLRSLGVAGEEASMVRVLAYRKNALVARATLIFTKAEGAPRKNSRGQYVIPLGKGGA